MSDVAATEAVNFRRMYICSKRAAREAQKASMHEDALLHLQRARDALLSLKKFNGMDKHLVRLSYARLESLFILGRYTLARKDMEFLLSREDILKRYGLFLRVMSFQGLYTWIKGDLPGARNISQEILALSCEHSSCHETIIRENARLSTIYIDEGNYQRAVECAYTALEKLTQCDEHKKFGLLGEMETIVLSCLSLAHAQLGNCESSALYAARALKNLDHCEDYFTKVCAAVFLAHGHIGGGHFRQAESLLKRALHWVDMVNGNILRPYILSALGVVMSELGDGNTGQKLCRQALSSARHGKIKIRLALFNLWYARALILEEKYSRALTYLKAALRQAQASGENGRYQQAYGLVEFCHEKLREQRAAA